MLFSTSVEDNREESVLMRQRQDCRSPVPSVRNEALIRDQPLKHESTGRIFLCLSDFVV